MLYLAIHNVIATSSNNKNNRSDGIYLRNIVFFLIIVLILLWFFIFSQCIDEEFSFYLIWSGSPKKFAISAIRCFIFSSNPNELSMILRCECPVHAAINSLFQLPVQILFPSPTEVSSGISGIPYYRNRSTVVLYCVKVMHFPAAFPHFWYLPPHLHLYHDGFCTVDNPTLLTQDFSFLHFCNHKQNRSGCLQKIYPPSQVSYLVPPIYFLYYSSTLQRLR